MNSFDSTPINLEITMFSDPPVGATDLLTGMEPQLFRSNSVTFNLGIFDRYQQSLDLSNLAFLEIDIFEDPPIDGCAIPGQEPLQFVTVDASEITASIARADWLAGLASQASITFPFELTNFDLCGRSSRVFWLLVHGITTGGRKIIYAGVPITVYESLEDGLYLPDNLAPLDIPLNTILWIKPNQQLVYSTPVTIEGILQLDGQFISTY